MVQRSLITVQVTTLVKKEDRKTKSNQSNYNWFSLVWLALDKKPTEYLFNVLDGLSSNNRTILHCEHRMHRKGKEKATPLAPIPVRSSTQPDIFINEEAEEQYRKLEKKAFHYERMMNVPEKHAEAIHNRLEYYGWKFIEFDAVEINEQLVKEFYANLLKGDTETVFLRGVQLDTSPHSLEALFQIPHIPPSRE
ncbi:uncharacterized protein LOC130948055 isoform X2 [Arachis stenosperma]|uniref:uncharacterized protein LOC130948055 isoform X2 n=1 Tax=Arachis stenosperma TaxID=217475 RepID=UPI0025AC9F73|nr:uncharacterized protein LOC130948055 isoform X2 [Arachis stenosperma]